MTTITATPPELAREIWDKLSYWHARAQELGAAQTENNKFTSFTLAGKTGAFRVYGPFDEEDVKDAFSVFWETLGHEGTRMMHIYPDRANYFRQREVLPLYEASGHEVCDTLEVGVVEVASPIEVPFGFASDGRIVAVTFTTDLNSGQRLTDGRGSMGLTEDTYVVDGGAFSRLNPNGSPNLVRWYTNLWGLVEQGVVVRLSDRIHQLPSELWARSKGPDTWLEFSGSDGRSPAFVTGAPYHSWDISSNVPSKHKRIKKEAKNPLRGWFK